MGQAGRQALSRRSVAQASRCVCNCLMLPSWRRLLRCFSIACRKGLVTRRRWHRTGEEPEELEDGQLQLPGETEVNRAASVRSTSGRACDALRPCCANDVSMQHVCTVEQLASPPVRMDAHITLSTAHSGWPIAQCVAESSQVSRWAWLLPQHSASALFTSASGVLLCLGGAVDRWLPGQRHHDLMALHAAAAPALKPH